MRQTFKRFEVESHTFATVDRVDAARTSESRSSAQSLSSSASIVDSELFELVEDAELCAALQADPELMELAELTQLARHVRETMAPTRRNVELSVRDRVRRICSAVLSRAGALPPEEALLDAATQHRIIARKLAEYRARKRGFAQLFSARVRGRRDGP